MSLLSLLTLAVLAPGAVAQALLLLDHLADFALLLLALLLLARLATAGAHVLHHGLELVEQLARRVPIAGAREILDAVEHF